MIVSWNWLKEYVTLDMPVAELERRLMMAGLNHETTEDVDGDLAIDFEVTSNRPDCLGHVGIAREVAVLWDRALKLPSAAPSEGAAKINDLTAVALECPQRCFRYTARVIRGVKIAASPAWLARRLATVGVGAINNVVDVTNYVLFECGQPLHAFDLAGLTGRRIVVREARAGESLEAIDHKKYELAPGMCVIADAERPVAIGGVMGGAASEVTEKTVDVLLESAEFDPRSIRDTARRLNLHSPSSYRFERGLDPEQVDWASRRACQLILDVAGGELASGVIDVGRRPVARENVVLRLSQLPRILGIDVPADVVRRILTALGASEVSADSERVVVNPPSWRRDLTREIDLVEEVARIHGYDAIAEDVSVPMASSARTRQDQVLCQARRVMTSAGFDEALTLSAVDQEWSAAFSPWTQSAPLVSPTPILRRADHLRRSLIPSLLGARRTNETLANPTIELFEIARVYLPRPTGLPEEAFMLGLTSGGDFFDVKGVIEALVYSLNPAAELSSSETTFDLFAPGRACELRLEGEILGYLGEVSPAGQRRFELRGATTVAEVQLDGLIRNANLTRQYRESPAFPAMQRDINLELPESARWADIARLARASAGDFLESIVYRETYRGDDRLVRENKKSLLFTLTLRDNRATLTGQQADAIRDQLVARCGAELGAAMRG